MSSSSTIGTMTSAAGSGGATGSAARAATGSTTDESAPTRAGSVSVTTSPGASGPATSATSATAGAHHGLLGADPGPGEQAGPGDGQQRWRQGPDRQHRRDDERGDDEQL